MRILMTGLACLAVAGCIPMPVPLRASPPRYTDAQLALLDGEGVVRTTVAGVLGAPDLARQGGTVWIYQWTVTSGRWIGVSAVGIGGADLGPLHARRFVRVFEFDAQDRLVRRAIAAPAGPAAEDRSCTATGLCVEHRVEVRRDANDIVESGFTDADSAVTWPPGPLPALPGGARCQLVAWLADGVARPWRGHRPPVTGVALAVTPESGGESLAGWLPQRAWQVLDLPAGAAALEIRPPAGGGATLPCPAGSRQFIEIARNPVAPEGPLQVRGVPVEQAGPALATRRRVLSR